MVYVRALVHFWANSLIYGLPGSPLKVVDPRQYIRCTKIMVCKPSLLRIIHSYAPDRCDVNHNIGPFVRIAPNHVSISDPSALHDVYAFGTNTNTSPLKSNFYDAFVSIHPALFTIRDRLQHARKRKTVAHIFSPKSILEFEEHIREHVEVLIEKWDGFCQDAKKFNDEVFHGEQGEVGWIGREGIVCLDCMPCESIVLFSLLLAIQMLPTY